MDKSFLIIAMSRTGHHAIINWIANQLPGNVKHYNNCYLNSEEILVPHKNRIVSYKSIYDTNFNIYSIENFDYFDRPDIIENKTHIIILRDILNWISSLIFQSQNWKQLYENDIDQEGRIGRNLIDIYKSHIKEAVGITNYLPNKIVIGYNKWTKDYDYRKQLSSDLNLVFTDEGFKTMPRFGDGSSFTGFAHETDAIVMDTLSRWNVLDKNLIKLVFEDKELIELIEDSYELIGEIPWYDKYISSNII